VASKINVHTPYLNKIFYYQSKKNLGMTLSVYGMSEFIRKTNEGTFKRVTDKHMGNPN
jgi:hypothetical protein